MAIITYQSVLIVENRKWEAIRIVPLQMGDVQTVVLVTYWEKKSELETGERYPGAPEACIRGCRTPIAPGKRASQEGPVEDATNLVHQIQLIFLQFVSLRILSNK